MNGDAFVPGRLPGASAAERARQVSSTGGAPLTAQQVSSFGDGVTFKPRSMSTIMRDFSTLNVEEKGSFSASRATEERWRVVSERFAERRGEFTEMKDVRVFCGTWNVNGKVEEDFYGLGTWLDSELQPVPDILAIGLQEMVDLSAMNVVMESAADNKSKSKMEKWSNVMQIAIERQGASCGMHYELVSEGHMVGICLLIFAADWLRPHMSNIQKEIVPTGAGGLGNKGGVAIRANIFDSSVAFVSAHLSAHRSDVARRNSDFHAIALKKVFRNHALRPVTVKNPIAPLMEPLSMGAARHTHSIWPFGASETPRTATPPRLGEDDRSAAAADHEQRLAEDLMLSIVDHDVVLWMGDLNYRIVEGVELDAVYEHIENGAEGHEALLALDQLNVERAAGRVFAGFQEGRLGFPPTYKYIPGVLPQEYDRRPDKKMRCPAWCDRVLWKTPQNTRRDASFVESVSLVQYRRVEGLCISDHLPVNAVLDVSVRNVMQDRLLRVCMEILQERGEAERSSVPVLMPMPKALWFSDVSYDADADVRVLLTASTTRLASVASAIAEEVDPTTVLPPVNFRFAHSCIPTWLDIEPREGCIPPGGEVMVRVHLSSSTAVNTASRNGEETLSTMLVIYVEGGNDVVLPVAVFLAQEDVFASL